MGKKPFQRAVVRANPGYLAWIRTLPCRIPGCNGPAEACHVRQNTGAGAGLKPSDRWAVPLCHYHHLEQHRLSHALFDARHKVDLRAYAMTLAAESGFWPEPAPA